MAKHKRKNNNIKNNITQVTNTKGNMIDSIMEKSAPFNYYPLNWRIPPDKKETDWLLSYSQNIWVYSAVSTIAQSVAGTKWKLFAYDSDGNQIEIKDQNKFPQLKLLKSPNPYMTWYDFIEFHQMYLELTGECYWIIAKNGLNEPAELWPVAPDRMWVVPNKEDFVQEYVYIYGGENIPMSPDEVMHFTYPNPLNVFKGTGPTQAAGLVIDNDVFSGEYAKNYFYNGAMPGGVIESPIDLNDTEYNRVKEQWNLNHQGVNKAHRIAILEGGAKFQSITPDIQQMQLSESRKNNRQDILASFGVPISVLGISENVNRANAESGEYTFAKRTIIPRLIKIEMAINEILLPMFSNAIKLNFIFDEATPEDQNLKLNKIKTGMQYGVMTVNEARKQLGLDPIEGGDVLRQPNNTTPTSIDDLQSLLNLAETNTINDVTLEN